MQTLAEIKKQAMVNILNLPDGEYVVRGGHGNKVLFEFKVENGIHYKRVNDEWVKIDL